MISGCWPLAASAMSLTSSLTCCQISTAPPESGLALLATFGNVRWGELAGLRRRYLDLDGRGVRVVETVYEFGQLLKGTPKSEAGKRKVTLPELIMPELRRHLDTYSAPARAVGDPRSRVGRLLARLISTTM